MREAELLKKDNKLPKLGRVLDARLNEMKLAAEKRKKRRDNCIIYVPEKYTGNWRKTPLLHTEINFQKRTNFLSDFDHGMVNI